MVYSLISGAWDKMPSDHNSKAGSEFQRTTVVGGNAGYLKNALNPAGLLHHNGGHAHMSAVSKQSEHYSLRNAKVPNAISKESFRTR